MGHDNMTQADIEADIKWIAELTTLEDKVNSPPQPKEDTQKGKGTIRFYSQHKSRLVE